MATRRARAKAGDVLQLRDNDRFGYLHYIGKHPKYGDTVIVSPRFKEQQTVIDNEYFSDGYVTFYPVAAALSEGLVEVIANISPPGLPARLRRPGAMTGNRVDTWVIEDGAHQIVRTKLSEEELRLPLAGIWNHEFLIQRIAMGWTPANYLGAA